MTWPVRPCRLYAGDACRPAPLPAGRRRHTPPPTPRLACPGPREDASTWSPSRPKAASLAAPHATPACPTAWKPTSQATPSAPARAPYTATKRRRGMPPHDAASTSLPAGRQRRMSRPAQPWQPDVGATHRTPSPTPRLARPGHRYCTTAYHVVPDADGLPAPSQPVRPGRLDAGAARRPRRCGSHAATRRRRPRLPLTPQLAQSASPYDAVDAGLKFCDNSKSSPHDFLRMRMGYVGKIKPGAPSRSERLAKYSQTSNLRELQYYNYSLLEP
ncbi:hypothetical protein U9M48_016465 [Paspalum notatum var. saurae]|uniref:Uncharacterized protein n=1 Tax=Paspalum notatum var. saurae TaxID=547442 RepID=A0AAQ3T5G0_PASNO